jgi:hypothetical protein
VLAKLFGKDGCPLCRAFLSRSLRGLETKLGWVGLHGVGQRPDGDDGRNRVFDAEKLNEPTAEG